MPKNASGACVSSIMSDNTLDAYNIADLRELARKRLPRGLFEFMDRGCDGLLLLWTPRTAGRTCRHYRVRCIKFCRAGESRSGARYSGDFMNSLGWGAVIDTHMERAGGEFSGRNLADSRGTHRDDGSTSGLLGRSLCEVIQNGRLDALASEQPLGERLHAELANGRLSGISVPRAQGDSD